MENHIFIVEGNQDIALLHRILTECLLLKEIKNIKKLNETLQLLVKKSFPFDKNSLNIFNEIPMFFEKNEKQICIINANGETNLLYELDTFFHKIHVEDIEKISSFTIFADGDLKNKQEKILELKNYIEPRDKKRKLTFISENSFIDDTLAFNVDGVNVKSNIFIFPNNKDSGRIENILLENIKDTYKNLHDETITHFENIKGVCNIIWSDENSYRDKALIGCIGNIIIPSASNVTLISNKDFEWINRENMTDDLKVLIAFLEGVLGE